LSQEGEQSQTIPNLVCPTTTMIISITDILEILVNSLGLERMAYLSPFFSLYDGTLNIKGVF
jgi:hypothetical protein